MYNESKKNKNTKKNHCKKMMKKPTTAREPNRTANNKREIPPKTSGNSQQHRIRQNVRKKTKWNDDGGVCRVKDAIVDSSLWS